MQDADSGQNDPGFIHDWRGEDIGVFTKVLHKSSTQYAAFRIGTVVGFTPKGRLRVEFTEDQACGKLAKPYKAAVLPQNVTVFREGVN